MSEHGITVSTLIEQLSELQPNAVLWATGDGDDYYRLVTRAEGPVEAADYYVRNTTQPVALLFLNEEDSNLLIEPVSAEVIERRRNPTITVELSKQLVADYLHQHGGTTDVITDLRKQLRNALGAQS